MKSFEKVLSYAREHKKAEEELQKSEARLSLIVQAGRIGFFEFKATKRALPDFHSMDINDAIHASVKKVHAEHPRMEARYPDANYAYDFLIKRRVDQEEQFENTAFIIPRRYNIAAQNISNFAFVQNNPRILMTDSSGCKIYTPSLKI